MKNTSSSRALLRAPLVLLRVPLALLCASFAFAACTEQPAHCDYRNVSPEGWLSTDTVVFCTDSLREEGRYAMDVLVRTSAVNPYRYQKLWLEVRQEWEVPCRVSLDTLVLSIKSSDGVSLGNGVVHHQHISSLDTLQLPASAKGKVILRHIMSDESLPGITEVGLKISKS